MRPMPELEVTKVATDDLVEYENNANAHTSEQVDQIASSIREFGFNSPVLAWHDDKGRPVVVAGNGRLMAARKLGIRELPVVFVDHMSDEQRRAFGLVENQLTRLSEFDWEMLEQELLGISSIDMAEYGFDVPIDFDGDGHGGELEPITADEDELPDISPTRAKEGQIWALGDHRLVCGDSTDPSVIEALMRDEVADLVLTDPPYNVDVGDCERPYSSNNGVHIMNDKMGEAEFVEFLTKALRNAEVAMRDGAAYYIFYTGLHHMEFEQSVRNVSRFKIHEQLVWVKSHFVLGRNSDYQWMHECCLYGWKDGAPHYFVDSRSEATVFEDEDVKLSTMKKDDLIELCERLLGLDKASTVLRAEKPNAAELHPTVKPQRLLTYLIRNSSRKGETVLDLFCGSGSTIIACEQMGRKCMAVELDPHYADVAIERYERFTGKKAEVVGVLNRGEGPQTENKPSQGMEE